MAQAAVLGDLIEVDGIARALGEFRAGLLRSAPSKQTSAIWRRPPGRLDWPRWPLATCPTTAASESTFPHPESTHSLAPHTAVRVQGEAEGWPAPDEPLVAGVSSFGMSGYECPCRTP